MQSLGDSALDAMLAAAQAGERRPLARLVSGALRHLPEEAYRLPYPEHVVGVAGAPGVGKSALLARLVNTAAEKTAVLAVDPASPFSGGSFLADRIRMGEVPRHVFFRSFTADAVAGGLVSGLGRVLRVLAAAGWQRVFIETVGSGQDEVKIHGLADTVVLVEAPGMGDDVQALKMGLLEIADIYAVNKKELPGAEALGGFLRAMLETAGPRCRVCRTVLPAAASALACAVPLSASHLPAPNTVSQAGPRQAGGTADRAQAGGAVECGWTPPVLQVSAATAEGVAELAADIGRHAAHHRSQRAAFDNFRRLSELLERVDTMYMQARTDALDALKQSAAPHEMAGDLLAVIMERLARQREGGTAGS